MSGPSPRGWGNLDASRHNTYDGRAIPTRVGKSLKSDPFRKCITGHPHAGGEISHSAVAGDVGGGPSPRGWGNRRQKPQPRPPPRAIPTRVGKSTEPSAASTKWAGHPHAGGEILAVADEAESVAGPSPRGWGNLKHVIIIRWHRRAIPTRVGKSGRFVRMRPWPPGHPHAGGEIKTDVHGVASHPGPSPRGWGNHASCGVGMIDGRAIPTRVGKSGRRRL